MPGPVATPDPSLIGWMLTDRYIETGKREDLDALIARLNMHPSEINDKPLQQEKTLWEARRWKHGLEAVLLEEEESGHE